MEEQGMVKKLSRNPETQDCGVNGANGVQGIHV
jgi:hypothetical protein